MGGCGAAARQEARIEDPTVEAAGGARAERTPNICIMVVTLDVPKLSGWLKADASCREPKGSIRRGAACGPGSGRAWSGGGASSVQGQASSGGCWQGTRGAHVKHVVHVCYAGGIPARYVCVELVQVIEEIGHVCDCRDAPARDGAVRRSGGSRVGVVLLGRRPQGGRVREGIGRWRRRSRRQWRRWWRRRRARAQAAPIRTVPIVKLGAARPCAPDEDLVCVGQRGALPRSIGSGATCRAGRRRGCCWSGV